MGTFCRAKLVFENPDRIQASEIHNIFGLTQKFGCFRGYQTYHPRNKLATFTD
jgi:hypothetical protein